MLINNTAWTLRHFPIFGVFGDGGYGIQLIYVDDLAQLAVAQGENRAKEIINAIGPESFTFKGLVEEIGRIIGKERPILSLPPRLGYAATRVIGCFVGDVFLTWEEVKGLMAGTLAVDTPPTAPTRLTEWAKKHAATLGKHYTSELARRTDHKSAYFFN